MIRVDALLRFLRRIVRSPFTGCWLWAGALSRWKREPWDGGYGQFKVDGRVVRAHRWLYERVVGPVPSGQVLLHTCDRRNCVNVYHLYPGTQLENIADMVAKGRAKPPPRPPKPEPEEEEDPEDIEGEIDF